MSKMQKVIYGKGYYLFKLNDLMVERGVSLNQLLRDTGLDYKILRRLRHGINQKVDLSVLSKLCDYFNCSIIDVIEYIPNSN